MAGEVWIKEAEDLKPTGSSGSMDGGMPRATWHVTVSPSGGGYFDAMHRVLTTNKSEPHILYDPVTDRLGQYFPLDRSARALANDGTRRTNGAGSVNIQIEVVANTSPVFTAYWKPGPNFRALMRAIRSWGVPDVWPNPRLATGYGDKVGRSWTTYAKAGHFGHCHVPGNDHWDPGPIDTGAIFRAASASAQEVGLAADDVQKVNDYTRALLLEGYTVGGVKKPSLLAILTETQRRVSEQTAANEAFKAEVRGSLKALAANTAVTDADLARIREEAKAGTAEAIKAITVTVEGA